ncbi:MAG: 3'-5' exonuclease, partial [Candidatus Bipolaricaulia bacterium]
LPILEKEYDPESAEDRRNNVRELIGQIKETEEETLDLEEFLENVALESDVDSYEDQNNKVSLLTLHSAKGLEFGYVFMVALEDGLLPHKRPLEEGGMEEERRLCYVGLTRAKNRVFLSYTDSRFLYGQRFSHLPSRFLEEVPDEEKRTVEGESGALSSGTHDSRVSSGGGGDWKDFIK